MSNWYRRDGDDLVLFLRIQPRASREGLGEVVDGYRKVRIQAPPVDGRANERLIRFLAKELGVNRGSILIEQGQKGRNKRVRVCGLDRMPAPMEDI